jgi:putative aldouronate transport system permease protein
VNSKGFQKIYYLMMIPGLIWIFFFRIIPMFGLVIAFKDFNPGKGVWGSAWVGLENFKYMFTLNDSKIIFINTVSIAVLKIIGNLIIPLIVAVMLNELRLRLLKRWVQTIVYLPHFISWVILAGIMQDVLSYHGPVNGILASFGAKPILFFARPELFQALIVGSDVWREFGFNAVIYLAALAAINPEFYEAAAVDGATRLQRIFYITLPGISTTVILLSVLSLGNVLNAGFDQIFNLYNPLVYSSGDIIDTWVYRTGILNLQYGLATAVGLLKSGIGLILISLSYYLAGKYANYRIF